MEAAITLFEIWLALIIAACGMGIALDYAIQNVEPNSKAEDILKTIIKVVLWIAYIKP